MVAALVRRVPHAPMSYHSDSLIARIRQLRASPLCRHLRFSRITPTSDQHRRKTRVGIRVWVDLGRFRLVLKGTLDLLIGVRIPASQFHHTYEDPHFYCPGPRAAAFSVTRKVSLGIQFSQAWRFIRPILCQNPENCYKDGRQRRRWRTVLPNGWIMAEGP